MVTATNGPTKIGHSKQPTARFKQFQAQSAWPDRLSLFWHSAVEGGYAADVEKRAHRLCAPYHSHYEWFHVTGREAVDALIDAAGRLGVYVTALGEVHPRNQITDREKELVQLLAHGDHRGDVGFLCRLFRPLERKKLARPRRGYSGEGAPYELTARGLNILAGGSSP